MEQSSTLAASVAKTLPLIPVAALLDAEQEAADSLASAEAKARAARRHQLEAEELARAATALLLLKLNFDFAGVPAQESERGLSQQQAAVVDILASSGGVMSAHEIKSELGLRKNRNSTLGWLI